MKTEINDKEKEWYKKWIVKEGLIRDMNDIRNKW